jgi:deazaflavin-dependent oxidoreductase (nitroreductase family)
MAKKTYKPSVGVRLVNVLFRWFARIGRGPETLHVLTVPGRKSGRPREVPIHVVEHAAHRYAVAIYGEQGWVRNVRANEGAATIERTRRAERVRLVEVSVDEAAEVLRYYTELSPHVLSYLDLPDQPTLNDWKSLATTHPAFRIEGAVGETTLRPSSV